MHHPETDPWPNDGRVRFITKPLVVNSVSSKYTGILLCCFYKIKILKSIRAGRVYAKFLLYNFKPKQSLNLFDRTDSSENSSCDCASLDITLVF